MKQANPPSSELSLDQLDEVVGGSAPIGLGASTATPRPQMRYASDSPISFGCSPIDLGSPIAPDSSPMGVGCSPMPTAPESSPMGVGCSPMPMAPGSPTGLGCSMDSDDSQQAPAAMPEHEIIIHDELVSMTIDIDDADAPQGLGGNR